ncbi:MAG: zinc ribbon domain-containing protein [Gemmatimonadota bacterium]|nr:zinc ribbon domain-containing protein [Gemmatimonadota bacterium]
MSQPNECPTCSTPLGPRDQTCQKCGTPVSWDLDPDHGAVASCGVCGTSMRAMELTCPSCGETGYPALRPRKGKGFKGSPEFEADRGSTR